MAKPRGTPLKSPVQRAHHATAPAIEHVHINHRRAHVVAPQKLLTRVDLIARHHHWQSLRLLRSLDPAQPGQFNAQNLPVQERHGTERLIPSRRSHAALPRRMRQKRRQLRRSHIPRTPLAVIQDEAQRSMHMGLLGTGAAMIAPNAIAQLIEKSWRHVHVVFSPRLMRCITAKHLSVVRSMADKCLAVSLHLPIAFDERGKIPMTTYKNQLIMTVVFLTFFSWSADSLATLITHNQTTLNKERITALSNPGAANTTENFQFDITNGTNINWADYHFQFVNPDGSVFFIPNTVSIANVMLLTDPFNQFRIDANNVLVGAGPERQALLTLFGGIVKPGDTFKGKLDLTYSNSVDVFGTPSIPEPSSLVLSLAGLLGFYFLRTQRRSV